MTSDRPPKGGHVVYFLGKHGGSSGRQTGVSTYNLLSSHGVPIGCVARSNRTCCWTVRREPGPARSPKPAAAASAERLQSATRVAHFNAAAGPRLDVGERL